MRQLAFALLILPAACAPQPYQPTAMPYSSFSASMNQPDPMPTATIPVTLASERRGRARPTPPDAQMIRIAEEAVSGALRDPSSAQFRKVKTVRDGESVIACGEVNGKNAYGGYVGFRSFLVGFRQQDGQWLRSEPAIRPAQYGRPAVLLIRSKCGSEYDTELD